MAHRVLVMESIKNVSAATNLKRRGAVYYCRRRVPQDLIQHYGKTELVVSLHTKNLAEARRRANDQWQQWEADFDALRQHAGAAHPAIELTDEQIQTLADEHYAGMLKWDEWSREQGLSEEAYAELTAEVAGNAEFLGSALARGDVKRGGFITHLTLQRHGITLPKDSPSYRKLTYALLKAAVKANDAVRERQQGKVVDTPQAPNTIRGSVINLSDVLDKWAAERSPRSKTKAEWTGIVRDFTKLNGKLPVSSIQKSHVIAYKDSLVEAKRAPGTIKTRLAAIHSLLQYALQNELCERNVAATVRVQATKARTREHIPIEDLQRLYSSDVFTKGDRPRAGKGEAAYWLPLLALFSGARLEELGQMVVQDVKRTADGIDYFEVTDQGEEQKLKTKGSRRAVPIHPELIRLGFLSYIQERRAAGDARVFPLLRKDTHGKWTKSWSQWWTRYRRSVGVDKKWHDMHALRHTFKRQCRECGIPKDIHDAITGHPSGDVADSYGGAYPIKPLAEAIRRLRYPGLVLEAV